MNSAYRTESISRENTEAQLYTCFTFNYWLLLLRKPGKIIQGRQAYFVHLLKCHAKSIHQKAVFFLISIV